MQSEKGKKWSYLAAGNVPRSFVLIESTPVIQIRAYTASTHHAEHQVALKAAYAQ